MLEPLSNPLLSSLLSPSAFNVSMILVYSDSNLPNCISILLSLSSKACVTSVAVSSGLLIPASIVINFFCKLCHRVSCFR